MPKLTFTDKASDGVGTMTLTLSITPAKMMDLHMQGSKWYEWVDAVKDDDGNVITAGHVSVDCVAGTAGIDSWRVLRGLRCSDVWREHAEKHAEKAGVPADASALRKRGVMSAEPKRHSATGKRGGITNAELTQVGEFVRDNIVLEDGVMPDGKHVTYQHVIAVLKWQASNVKKTAKGRPELPDKPVQKTAAQREAELEAREAELEARNAELEAQRDALLAQLAERDAAEDAE